MKHAFLKSVVLTALLCVGISASAQDEFSFAATQWTSNNGAIDTNGGVITCTGYQWGCTGVKNENAFKVKTAGRYLLIKGTNIYDGTSNPCVMYFNGADQEYKPKLTVNASGTKAYIDMSGYYSSLTADGDYYTINGIGFYMQEPTMSNGTDYDAPTVITDMEFVSALPVDPVAYSFDATKWTANPGAITTDGNQISATAYQWGCFGIKNETPYLIKASDKYLILHGTNLYDGTNNPCLNTFGSEVGNKKLTVNSDNTMAYIDLSSIIESFEQDTEGYITVSGIILYIQSETGDTYTEEGHPVITDIEFASSVPVDADPFAFIPSEWNSTSGSISTAANQIDCTEYQWGCTGIMTETPFKVKKGSPVYLTLTGRNIYDGTTNPCLYNFNSENFTWKPKFTVSDDNTVASLEISSLLADLEADEDGYVTIFSMGIYLQEEEGSAYTEEGHTVITNIEFIADDLTGIEAIGQFDDLQSGKQTNNDAIYDLSGRKVSHLSPLTSHPKKGIYIINGKKVAF